MTAFCRQTPNGVTVLLTFGGDHCLRPVDHRKVVAWKFATDTRPATIYSREEYWKHLNLHTKYRKNTQMMADWDVSLVRIDEPLKLPEKSDVTYNPRTHPLNRICIDTSINFNYQCGDDLYAIGYGQKGTVIDQALAFMQHTIQYDKGNNNQPEYWDPRFSWNLLQGAITGPLFYLAGNFQLNSDGALRSIATCAVCLPAIDARSAINMIFREILEVRQSSISGMIQIIHLSYRLEHFKLEFCQLGRIVHKISQDKLRLMVKRGQNLLSRLLNTSKLAKFKSGSRARSRLKQVRVLMLLYIRFKIRVILYQSTSSRNNCFFKFKCVFERDEGLQFEHLCSEMKR